MPSSVMAAVCGGRKRKRSRPPLPPPSLMNDHDDDQQQHFLDDGGGGGRRASSFYGDNASASTSASVSASRHGLESRRREDDRDRSCPPPLESAPPAHPPAAAGDFVDHDAPPPPTHDDDNLGTADNEKSLRFMNLEVKRVQQEQEQQQKEQQERPKTTHLVPSTNQTTALTTQKYPAMLPAASAAATAATTTIIVTATTTTHNTQKNAPINDDDGNDPSMTTMQAVVESSTTRTATDHHNDNNVELQQQYQQQQYQQQQHQQQHQYQQPQQERYRRRHDRYRRFFLKHRLVDRRNVHGPDRGRVRSMVVADEEVSTGGGATPADGAGRTTATTMTQTTENDHVTTNSTTNSTNSTSTTTKSSSRVLQQDRRMTSTTTQGAAVSACFFTDPYRRLQEMASDGSAVLPSVLLGVCALWSVMDWMDVRQQLNAPIVQAMMRFHQRRYQESQQVTQIKAAKYSALKGRYQRYHAFVGRHMIPNPRNPPQPQRQQPQHAQRQYAQRQRLTAVLGSQSVTTTTTTTSRSHDDRRMSVAATEIATGGTATGASRHAVAAAVAATAATTTTTGIRGEVGATTPAVHSTNSTTERPTKRPKTTSSSSRADSTDRVDTGVGRGRDMMINDHNHHEQKDEERRPVEEDGMGGGNSTAGNHVRLMEMSNEMTVHPNDVDKDGDEKYQEERRPVEEDMMGGGYSTAGDHHRRPMEMSNEMTVQPNDVDKDGDENMKCSPQSRIDNLHGDDRFSQVSKYGSEKVPPSEAAFSDNDARGMELNIGQDSANMQTSAELPQAHEQAGANLTPTAADPNHVRDERQSLVQPEQQGTRPDQPQQQRNTFTTEKEAAGKSSTQQDNNEQRHQHPHDAPMPPALKDHEPEALQGMTERSSQQPHGHYEYDPSGSRGNNDMARGQPESFVDLDDQDQHLHSPQASDRSEQQDSRDDPPSDVNGLVEEYEPEDERQFPQSLPMMIEFIASPASPSSDRRNPATADEHPQTRTEKRAVTGPSIPTHAPQNPLPEAQDDRRKHPEDTTGSVTVPPRQHGHDESHMLDAEYDDTRRNLEDEFLQQRNNGNQRSRATSQPEPAIERVDTSQFAAQATSDKHDHDSDQHEKAASYQGDSHGRLDSDPSPLQVPEKKRRNPYMDQVPRSYEHEMYDHEGDESQILLSQSQTLPPSRKNNPRQRLSSNRRVTASPRILPHAVVAQKEDAAVPSAIDARTKLMTKYSSSKKKRWISNQPARAFVDDSKFRASAAHRAPAPVAFVQRSLVQGKENPTQTKGGIHRTGRDRHHQSRNTSAMTTAATAIQGTSRIVPESRLPSTGANANDNSRNKAPPPVDMYCRAAADDEKKAESPKFRYQEVVRKKSERETLRQHDCEECAKFINAVMAGNGKNVFDKDELIGCSRHRARHTPPSTPPDFWELSFMDETKAKAAREKEAARLARNRERQNGVGAASNVLLPNQTDDELWEDRPLANRK